MTIPKKIIELAIEGEYKLNESQRNFSYEWLGENKWREFILDPSFWQALGKSLGWSNYAVCRTHGVSCALLCSQAEPFEWVYQAHTFYDLILTGGGAEKFWDDLLKALPDNK